MLFLAAGVFITMLVTGCEEQNVQDIKRSRLIANENRLLKKQLEQTEKKLEKCRQEEKARENASTPMTYVIGENQKLTKENKELKVQIEQLKKGVEELKKPANP